MPALAAPSQSPESTLQYATEMDEPRRPNIPPAANTCHQPSTQSQRYSRVRACGPARPESIGGTERARRHAHAVDHGREVRRARENNARRNLLVSMQNLPLVCVLVSPFGNAVGKREPDAHNRSLTPFNDCQSTDTQCRHRFASRRTACRRTQSGYDYLPVRSQRSAGLRRTRRRPCPQWSDRRTRKWESPGREATANEQP